jgi:hypothetical protein
MIESPFEPQILEALRAIVRQQQTARAEDQANEKRWWPPSPSWAIVYVTVVYVVVAIFQWRAIRRQANIANTSLIEARKAARAASETADALKLTERAFVLLDERVSPDPRPDKREMSYVIVNCGKTPAYIKTVKAEMRFTDSASPPPVNPFASKSHRGDGEMAVLGPDQTLNAGVDLPNSEPLDCERIEAINNKTSWLWFCGWIVYSDAFDNEHFTVWTRYWNPTEEDIPQGVFGFPNEPGYNYAK